MTILNKLLSGIKLLLPKPKVFLIVGVRERPHDFEIPDLWDEADLMHAGYPYGIWHGPNGKDIPEA